MRVSRAFHLGPCDSRIVHIWGLRFGRQLQRHHRCAQLDFSGPASCSSHAWHAQPCKKLKIQLLDTAANQLQLFAGSSTPKPYMSAQRTSLEMPHGQNPGGANSPGSTSTREVGIVPSFAFRVGALCGSFWSPSTTNPNLKILTPKRAKLAPSTAHPYWEALAPDPGLG